MPLKKYTSPWTPKDSIYSKFLTSKRVFYPNVHGSFLSFICFFAFRNFTINLKARLIVAIIQSKTPLFYAFFQKT